MLLLLNAPCSNTFQPSYLPRLKRDDGPSLWFLLYRGTKYSLINKAMRGVRCGFGVIWRNAISVVAPLTRIHSLVLGGTTSTSAMVMWISCAHFFETTLRNVSRGDNGCIVGVFFFSVLSYSKCHSSGKIFWQPCSILRRVTLGVFPAANSGTATRLENGAQFSFVPPEIPTQAHVSLISLLYHSLSFLHSFLFETVKR